MCCTSAKHFNESFLLPETHFNAALQICDYPYNLYAPCGTKGPDPNAPPTTTTTTTTTTVPTTITTAAASTTAAPTTDVANATSASMNNTDSPAAAATFQVPVVVG